MLFVVTYSDITFCVTYTAVVALLATSRTFTALALVRALTAQMAETTAGVAGLASHSTSTAVVEVVVATSGAVAGDVARLSALSEGVKIFKSLGRALIEKHGKRNFTL